MPLELAFPMHRWNNRRRWIAAPKRLPREASCQKNPEGLSKTLISPHRAFQEDLRAITNILMTKHTPMIRTTSHTATTTSPAMHVSFGQTQHSYDLDSRSELGEC
jgi:hypothetical protein